MLQVDRLPGSYLSTNSMESDILSHSVFVRIEDKGHHDMSHTVLQLRMRKTALFRLIMPQIGDRKLDAQNNCDHTAK